MKKYRGALRLVGVLALIALVLLFKIDLRETLNLILRANYGAVALAVLFFIPFLLVKAWRWQIILRDLGVKVPFGEAVRLYALGLGAGMLTPGQVGDAVKAAYFRERGLTQALVSVVLDRLWDVLILLVLAGTGLLMFWQQFEGEWVAFALLLVGTVVLLGLTVHHRSQKWLIQQVMRLRKSSAPVEYNPPPIGAGQVLVQFGLSVLATGVVYFRLWLITAALGVQLDPVPFVATMSLATMAGLLPISILGGVGARDAALLLIAPLIGIAREQALGISALILLLSVVNGVVGLLVWLAQPQSSRRINSTAEQRSAENKAVSLD